MFMERINNVTGQREWVVADENYDLAQEIARSAFADMLLDHDRNWRYKQALETIVREKKKNGEFVHVVDIGTGTGLLSLMAAEAGADKVTAIEVFQPMAKMASEIFHKSKFNDKIELISSRSTELNKSSLSERGNLIVAEVFDTELIGEGALRTFKEAHDTLVKKGSRVIPSSARIWILPVESNLLEKFNKTPSKILKSPFEDCPGSAAVFDVQLSELSLDDFILVCDPFIAFEFNFEDPDSIKYDEWKICEVVPSNNATMNAVFMWWDLDMDGTGQNILTMAPTWKDPNSQWRDHWLQAVYFLPEKRKATKGEAIKMHCSHDEYSLWFSIGEKPMRHEKPLCTCQMHAINARSSFYRVNYLEENEAFMRFVETACHSKTIVCLNEGSLIGLYAARFASNVTIVDSNPYFRMILEKYRKANHFSNVLIVESVNEITNQPELVLSEPFYFSAINSWNNLRFWFDVEKLRTKFPDSNFDRGVLYAMPVKFHHLWKISSKIGMVEGYDLSKYDELCASATDPIVDPQPLWEYGSICKGNVSEIACFDFTTNLTSLAITNEIEMSTEESLNAITFWMDWEFSNGLTLNTGLMEPCQIESVPKWHPGHRQGVHFIDVGDAEISKVRISTKFDVYNGELTYQIANC